MSKGHGCLAQYVVLADKGFFDEKELLTFCHKDSILGGHPEYGKIPGVEASTGALGHGMSIGVGMAVASRLQKRKSRVVVIVGDGEINEGSVWEAAMSAAKHQLSNFTVIIDYNKIQSYGFVSEVLDTEPMADKWTSFGFSVKEINVREYEYPKIPPDGAILKVHSCGICSSDLKFINHGDRVQKFPTILGHEIAGEIIEIDRQNNRAKVKGINIVKKHLKATKEKKGGIISKENFINISNLSIFEKRKSKTKEVKK